METLKYWKKQEKPLYSDLAWNFPEQKSGSVSIVGGNSGSFNVVSRASAKLTSDFPIKDVYSVLPDSLKKSLPPVPNLTFCPSTDSGSFSRSSEFSRALQQGDFSLLIGDFGKNSETAVALAEALLKSDKPALITRDSIDLLAPEMMNIVEKPNVILMGSMAQMQKIFRAVYYPKVLLLSMPVLPVIEALHKFTLSYPCTLLTFHEGLILIAHDGDVISTKITQTNYSPISLWDGRLAVDIVGTNLFNPKKPLEATSAALVL